MLLIVVLAWFTASVASSAKQIRFRVDKLAYTSCEPQVFILSVRSGAVGINLTSANHVFMMEPLMNPALDDQAVGRAWRMGQKRRVTVKRLYVKGTLEESIMKLAADRRVRPRCLFAMMRRGYAWSPCAVPAVE